MPKTSISDALQKRINLNNTPESDSIDKAYDDMFGAGHVYTSDQIVELDLSKLIPHPHDPFKPYQEDKLKELADSIKKVGLLDPINVRPHKGGYEILAGKNRANALQLNGGTKIKAIIRDVDDDTAIIIITESNLKHREKLLPSEKAFAYKLQLDAKKKQGKRDDLAEKESSEQFARKLESAYVVAEHNEVSKDEVRRYIRLTNLIPELLDLVDAEKIPLIAGVNLSFLDEQAQKEVYCYFFESKQNTRLNLIASVLIKQAFVEGKSVTIEKLVTIVNKQKDRQKPKPFSISRSKFKGYTDIPDDKELEKLFFEFLKVKFG